MESFDESFNEYKIYILKSIEANEEAIGSFAKELKDSLSEVYGTLRWYFVLLLGIVGTVFGYVYFLSSDVEARVNVKIEEIKSDDEKTEKKLELHINDYIEEKALRKKFKGLIDD